MAISQLDQDIVLLSPKLNKGNVPVVRIIQEAYRYFKKTGRATGLVDLAVLLEDEKIGWIPRILNNPMRGVHDRFFNLIDALRKVNEANRYCDKLQSFRSTRNWCHSMKLPEKDKVETAFKNFLEFTRWYYKAYYQLDSISDEKYYRRVLAPLELLDERFQIVELLGSDGYSQTYKAIDRESNDNHLVVIKRPFVNSKRYSEIIRNEKKSRVLFNGHPNIGGCYSSHELTPVGEILKLEYIEGETLRSWIRKASFNEKGLSDFFYIIGRVLNGIKYIHAKNYVHGSISPDSILVAPNSEVRIVSFDWCQYVSRKVNDLEKEFRNVDPFSPGRVVCRDKTLDTYALGVILRDSLAEVRVPESVSLFIDKATQNNAKDRYQDANIMALDWEKTYQMVRYKVPGEDEQLRKVALISCTRRKKPYMCTARELYSESERFANALAYVENPVNQYEKCYVISARYGLVDLDQQLSPYDCDLLEFPPQEQACWAGYVAQLLQWKDVDCKCKVIVHADNLYGNLIIKALKEKGISAELGCF